MKNFILSAILLVMFSFTTNAKQMELSTLEMTPCENCWEWAHNIEKIWHAIGGLNSYETFDRWLQDYEWCLKNLNPCEVVLDDIYIGE